MQPLELGKIMLTNYSVDELTASYGIAIDPNDHESVKRVGLQALLWGDINRDGTLN